MFAARQGFFPPAAAVSSATSGLWKNNTATLLSTTSTTNLITWKATTGYTVEYWIYVPSTATLANLANGQTDVPWGPGNHDNAGTNYNSFGLSPTLQVQYYYWGSGKFSVGTAANAVTTDSWNNIAMVATTVGSTFTMRIFVNGVQTNIRLNNAGAYASTYSNTNGVISTATPYQFGPWQGANSPAVFIDEFRVSNTARYTSNYTPATAPFTSDASTQYLIQFNGAVGSTTFTDSSGFARTITNPSPFVTVSDVQGKF